MTVVSREFVRLAGSLIALASLFLLAILHQAFAADVASLRGRHIVFVEPYGPDSVTNFPLALMRDEIARKTGATVDIVPIGGRAGGSALDYVLSPPPAIAEDAIVFAVLDVMSRGLAESAGGRTRLLQAMQPVATVSGALSSALVVADNSDIRTIDDFLARARTRELRIVGLGRKAAFGIELAMLEKASGLGFAEKPAATRAEILVALQAGEADAGFLVTVTLLPSSEAAPPVRPILTFGAARNPALPDVPTFRESLRQDQEGDGDRQHHRNVRAAPHAKAGRRGDGGAAARHRRRARDQGGGRRPQLSAERRPRRHGERGGGAGGQDDQAAQGRSRSLSALFVVADRIALRVDAQAVEQAVRIVEIGADLVDLEDLPVIGAGRAAALDIGALDRAGRARQRRGIADEGELLAGEFALGLLVAQGSEDACRSRLVADQLPGIAPVMREAVVAAVDEARHHGDAFEEP
jgi:tripartite-type tricarboxylate transporter receptor subunit TctC